MAPVMTWFRNNVNKTHCYSQMQQYLLIQCLVVLKANPKLNSKKHKVTDFVKFKGSSDNSGRYNKNTIYITAQGS